MNILTLEVCGFRRFESKTSVRLSERLIAVLGPNEAGKSSVLEALLRLNNDEAIPDRDITRRGGTEPHIKARFELDRMDREFLSAAGIDDADSITQCTIEKKKDGRRQVTIDRELPYDTASRLTGKEALERIVPEKFSMALGNKEQRRQFVAQRDGLIAELSRNENFLGSAAVSSLQEFIGRLDGFARSPQVGDETKLVAAEAVEVLRKTLAAERLTPGERLRKTLVGRLPAIVRFEETSRNLKSTYDLADEKTFSSQALSNLARVAGLELLELKAAALARDAGAVAGIIDKANTNLSSIFSQAWASASVTPRFYLLDGTVLHILVGADKGGYLPLEHRSDGLRWFVSLLAFIHGVQSSSGIVLLIDEAETHLSYDAQANLVELLEQQHFAQKILYTTHSAGCLPSDLGTGCRLVVPLENERSGLENCFWVAGGGFTPLLTSMGLRPFAFTPARNVVLAEGASECILLPTLLRKASRTLRLPFQVAPGASETPKPVMKRLLAEGGRVAFVLDGDEGGQRLRASLIEADVPEEQVATYRDFSDEPIALEDLLTAESFAMAVNRELQRWQTPAAELGVADVPLLQRFAFLKKWLLERDLRNISKVAIAHAIVELSIDGKEVVAANRAEVLEKLYQWLKVRFEF